jgi:O-antigen ligase
MNEPIDAINWVRWLFYLLGGVPLLGWILFTRDRVARLMAVLTFLLMVQDNIVGRRYVMGGFSIAPSTGLMYVALLAEVMSQRRLPRLGAYLPLWIAFLFFAASNILVGSLGTGLWAVTYKYFQIFYLEGILVFAYGLMALRTNQDVLRYSRYIVLLGAAVAAAHIFTIATGFRFRNSIEEYAGIYYAGVLDNANSLGSLYAMWLPVALSILVGRRQPPFWRFAIMASMAIMFASLILSASRGGLLFAILTSILAFTTSRIGARRAIIATVATGIGVGLGYFLLILLAPDAFREVLGLVEYEGTQSDRLRLFARYLQMLGDHPLGIGLAPANFAARIAEYHIPGVVSAHNIYLDIALQTGVLGLLMFLAIVVSILALNRRAAGATTEPREREILVYLLLPLVGFLGAGWVEPIYSVSNKLNNTFWIACGVSVAASQRILAARRAAAAAEPPTPFGSRAEAQPS